MNIIKKFVVIFVTILIIILGFLPTFSYAGSLNDAQRKALVDTMVKLIDEGNKARILRYSQGHRMVGYNYQKMTKSDKQLTSGNVNLTDADLGRIKAILMREQGVEKVEDLYKMPTTLGYKCFFTGDDINDTIPFDCSSLVSAAYNFTVGTPYGGWAWNSTKYSENTDWFSVSSDMSSLKPGDILWKKGHVALYLGDCYGNGKKYIAEAFGFAKINKSAPIMRQRLLDFLDKNPEYIVEHPNFNGQKPKLQLPADGVMDVTKQVIINEYKPGRFNKVATYIGPVAAGRAIDVTNLKTTNPGNGSGIGSDGSQSGDGSLGNGGLDHDPINLPGNYTVVWPKDMVLEDQNLATSEGYFYKGTPTYGQYVGRIDLFNWLIGSTGDVLDWLTGFVTYAFKAALIGWTAIMENVMSNILNFGITPMSNQNPTALNGEITALSKISSGAILGYTVSELNNKNVSELTASTSQKDGLVSVATLADESTPANGEATNKPTVTNSSDIDASETKKKITIEDVLFNRVPVLDINFFDFENAGGQKLSEGSLLYKIRETIAGWYYVIRMAVIMGMLLVLLYLAIKIAISMPGKKAEYKSKLMDWVVGFIIVFFIHYFMLAIISFNNQIVKLLDPVITAGTTVDTPDVETGSNSNIVTTNDGQTSLYEAIRIQSYDIRATTGLTATVMYMVLVFLMIRFVILYAKRMFVIAVLTVISPIMGLLYSINKKKYKIGDWGKEYIYNVLIQFIHVVIYTAIVGFAFDLSKTSTFRGGLIALMALAFIYGAEELVKKIFGFNKASTSGSLASSTVGQLAVMRVASSLYNKAEEKAKKVQTTSNTDDKWFRRKYNENLHKNMSVSDWMNKYAPPENGIETGEEARERRANKVLDSKAYKPDTVILNGQEYIANKNAGPSLISKTAQLFGINYVDNKNGVPMTPYEPIDPDKVNYFNMSTINTRIEEAMKEETKARRAYAMQGLSDIYKSVTGSFSIMAAVPMLVLSPAYGLGLGAYGIHSIASSMGRRKIEGAKSTGEKRKWTGKRLVFAWATAGMSEGVVNMYHNSADQNYVLQTNYVKKVELLKAARETEDKLAREIVELELERMSNTNNFENGEETEKVKEAKEKMDKVARDIDKQEFEKAVNLTLEEVKKKDIEKIVGNYIAKKKDGQLTNKDIENITKDLGRNIDGKYKDITLNNEFSDIIREEIRNRVITAGDYIIEANDTAASIREKYSRNNNNSSSDTDNTNKTSMFGKDMTKQATDNDTTDKQKTEKPTVHLKDNDNKKISKKTITSEKLEEKVDNVIKHMKQEELVDIIEVALKRKESLNREIKNPKYARLMERVAELNKIHSDFKELTGEEMYQKYEAKDKKIHVKHDNSGEIEYQSVSEIVKSMRDYLVNYINYDV